MNDFYEIMIAVTPLDKSTPDGAAYVWRPFFPGVLCLELSWSLTNLNFSTCKYAVLGERKW